MGRKSRNKALKLLTGTPTTPHGSTSNDTETPTQSGARDPKFPLSPSTTPPTSPSSPSIDLVPPTMSQSSTVPLAQTQPIPVQTIPNPTISAEDIISKDIIAIAEMFSTMKKTMAIMTNAFDRFEIQTEKFAVLGLDIKAAEQVCLHLIVICRLTLISLSSWLKCVKPWMIKSQDRKVRLRFWVKNSRPKSKKQSKRK